MTDASNTYLTAVRRFLDLAEAPLSETCATPRMLATASGLAPSSGYRAIASLESAGLVKRDIAGAYTRGERAYRIGLSAYGLGRLGPIAAPILDRLRRSTDRTAFLGVRIGDDLAMGPFSFGRGAAIQIPIERRYRAHLRRIGVADVEQFTLEGSSQSLCALVVGLPACSGSAVSPVVGLLEASRFDGKMRPDHHQALSDARVRFVGAQNGSGPDAG